MPNSIKKITTLWDQHGISTPFSSTCSGNLLHHEFDNKIENYRLELILERILNKQCKQKFESIVDIGSGLGRFLGTLSFYCDNVLALEPAASLFGKLEYLWKDNQSITCNMMTWEEYISLNQAQYDLVLGSGVLYLYDQNMLDEFFFNLSSCLRPNGVFIARDFLTLSLLESPSTFMENGFCYYRNLIFWKKQAESYGLTLQICVLSKPKFSLLKNKYISKILSLSRLDRFVWRHNILFKYARIQSLVNYSPDHHKGITTCFLQFTKVDP